MNITQPFKPGSHELTCNLQGMWAALDETEGGKIIFEDTTQSADGTIKIRINGEDKYIQVYNSY